MANMTNLSNLNMKITFIAGGSAGDHTLTGVATDDELACVMHVTTAVESTYGFTISSSADITSEFTISAAATINNGGGTDTSNDHLLILWMDKDAA